MFITKHQTTIYPITCICAHHRLYSSDWNKNPAFSVSVWNSWQNMMVQSPQTQPEKNMTNSNLSLLWCLTIAWSNIDLLLLPDFIHKMYGIIDIYASVSTITDDAFNGLPLFPRKIIIWTIAASLSIKFMRTSNIKKIQTCYTRKMSRKIYLLFMPKCVTSTHEWIWWFQVTIHMRPHIIMI